MEEVKEVKTKELIKNTIISLLSKMRINLDKIILFGSRARGDYKGFSDWNLLVVVKENLNIKKKMEISKEIRQKLARSYIDCDVIIKSENEVGYYANLIGSVTREAIKEGISL